MGYDPRQLITGDEGMGRKAQHTVAFNDLAMKRRLKEAKGQPQQEWRVDTVRGLVLVTQPTCAGYFFLFYSAKHGERRKLKLGQYGDGNNATLTLQDARAKAGKALAMVERGEDPAGDAAALRVAITFEELATQFLSEAPIAATTRHVYGYTLSKGAYPIIGKLPADAVTSDHIVKICKRIEATGAQVQSERTKSAIGGVYRWAIRQRLAKANPCKDIGRRSQKVARTRTPSDAELAALWEATTQAETKLSRGMRYIIQLGIVCGQRRAELCGARVSELQLQGDAPMWVIPGHVSKRGKITPGRTKNKREQRLPLCPQAAELFRAAVRDCADGDYVFPADMTKVKVGKTPRTLHIAPDSVSMAMRRLREACDIEDISIHDMRRAISNWLKDQGVSREVRDLILNHKDPSVTEEHYSATARMEKQVRAAMTMWAEHVWEITRQGTAAENVVKLRA